MGLGGEGQDIQAKDGLKQEVGRRHRRDQLNTTRQANQLRNGKSKIKVNVFFWCWPQPQRQRRRPLSNSTAVRQNGRGAAVLQPARRYTKVSLVEGCCTV